MQTSHSNRVDVSALRHRPALRPPRAVDSVCLVAMPWARPTSPSLGLGILKASLKAAGTNATVLHGNLFVGARMPFLELATIGETPLASVLISALLTDDPARRRESLRLVLDNRNKARFSSPIWESEETLDRFVQEFDADVVQFLTDWQVASYDVAGFSLVFEQTLPSLVAARHLKRMKPDGLIVFGGASCDGEMGPALLEVYPWVDYVVSGEGEHALPELIGILRRGEPLDGAPGVSYRDASGTIRVNAGRPPTDLDGTPIPDFTDYFEQLRRSPLRAQVMNPTLPFETSRGCWWGQKHLCTFCGLNAETIGFRRKSAPRVLNEVSTLASRHAMTSFTATDNILDFDAFKGWLPDLVDWQRRTNSQLTIFFEIKSNLKREQITRMAEAGVQYVQPGIESFHDGILARMDKGATGLQQVQCIKWLDEDRVWPAYNLIVCNPGDRPSDYAEMTAMIPLLTHLPPPAGPPIPMMLQRFSPYYERPQQYQISGVRASRWTQVAHHLAGTAIDRLAYTFEYDHPDLEALTKAPELRALIAAVKEWRDNYRRDRLTYAAGPGFMKVIDARHGTRTRVITLNGLPAAILRFCDGIRSRRALVEAFSETPAADVDRTVRELEQSRLLLIDPKDRLLSLPVQRRTPMP